MKPLKLLLMLGLFGLFSSAAHGQTARYLQGWKMIAESETFVDISFSVIQCDDLPEIFVAVFNENSMKQSVNFDIVLTDPASGGREVRSYRDISLEIGELKQPDCENDKFPGQKLVVPEGFDPTTVQVAVKFL